MGRRTLLKLNSSKREESKNHLVRRWFFNNYLGNRGRLFRGVPGITSQEVEETSSVRRVDAKHRTEDVDPLARRDGQQGRTYLPLEAEELRVPNET